MQIEVSPETRERIEHLIESGEYASAEDAVRAGLDALSGDLWVPTEEWLAMAGPKLEEARRGLVEGGGRIIRNREEGRQLIEEIIARAKQRRAVQPTE